MYLSPEAKRLLDDMRRAHERLMTHFHADDAHRRAFRAVYEALESALGDLDDDWLVHSPHGEWSPAAASASRCWWNATGSVSRRRSAA